MRWPIIGGTEVATLRIVETLSPEFSRHVFAAYPQSPTGLLFSGRGLEVVPYQVDELSLRRPLPFLRSSLRLAWLFRRSHVALVHCSGMTAALDATLAARFARLPVICHVRNPHEHLARRYRSILRLATHFVFVADHARRHFAFHTRPTRTSIIYDGLQASDPSPVQARALVEREFGISKDAVLIGMVARLAAQKDHGTLLQAMPAVLASRPDAHLLLVGDSSGTSESRRRYEDLCRLAHRT
jgi:glycosyltransferase involved in cell wall biosynthesis